MSAKYKSPSFLLPNEINTNTNPLNTDGNPATGTGIVCILWTLILLQEYQTLQV
jgi:hypothetical protein